MENKRKVMILVAVVFLISLVFVSSAMRLETKYAYGSDRIGIEYFAVFYIPHDTLQVTLGTESSKYSPYIGGINSFIVANIIRGLKKLKSKSSQKINQQEVIQKRY